LRPAGGPTTGSAAAGSRSARTGRRCRGHPVSAAERDAEIRQLLEARNARRAARGEAPLDIEAELHALTAATAADPELAAEVRQLVEARNARRLARGQPPLDVEAEVSKRLREG
jgi:hypothetical protein